MAGKKIVYENWMPKIGEKITPLRGSLLCTLFGFNELAEHVENNLLSYKSFVFDGCSMIPDRALMWLGGRQWHRAVYQACLPHDLRYAYGQMGAKAERKKADKDFYYNLLAINAPPRIARIMLRAVRLGGPEWLNMSFSWGFASQEVVKYGDRVTCSRKFWRVHGTGEKKMWEERPLKETDCIFLGTRTLRNGDVDYNSGLAFKMTDHFKAALVSPGPRSKPVYVPLDAITKKG